MIDSFSTYSAMEYFNNDFSGKRDYEKHKNINIRISEHDLESIKLLAAREGLRYQTLIGSLIHKYASGAL